MTLDACGTDPVPAPGPATPTPALAAATGLPRRGRTGSGTALIVLSGASFGVMPILAKLVYDDGADPVGLLSARFTIAGLLLLALALMRGEALPRGRTLAALATLGGVGYASEAFCYFFSLEHASAGVTALLLYLYPALVVLIVAATERHWPGRLTAGCLLAAVVGTALTVGPSGGADGLGVAFGLAAAGSYAVYIVISGRLAGGLPPLAASAVVMLSAAVTDDVVAATAGAHYPRHASGWVSLASVAVIGTVVAVSTFFAGLARVGASRASILSTVEPVVSVALGVAVLSEPLSVAQAGGAVLVLAAVVVLAVRPATPRGAVAQRRGQGSSGEGGSSRT